MAPLPAKQAKYTPDDMVKKLTMLFVLDQMEIPLTENNLIDICTNKNSWLGYMDCKDVLWQLEEVHFVFYTKDVDSETRIVITPEGRDCLSHFFLKVPTSVREMIAGFAKKNRMKFKRSQEYVGKYSKNVDGTYTAFLQIKDQLENKNVFEIRIVLSSTKACIGAIKNWKDHAPEIYEDIFEKLE